MMRQIQKTDRNGRGRRILKKGRISAFLWIAAVCVLCCGCGRKGGTALIGDTKKQTEDNASSEGSDGDTSSGITDTGTGSSQAAGDAGSVSGGAGGTGTAGVLGDPAEAALIRVYVCGAVASPGVVEIPAGSRAEDALLAAGGFADEAAREAVNLADWVNDGQKLYFPAEGEELPPEETSAGADAGSGLVNINTADAAALCTLSGVGESRAADIIAYREANGGFDSCEDIMKVPGIKNAMYEKIKDQITVK